jgi:hypothetical protein|nr:MAG TPA: hypothetical protein [Crassvirales sp.]
MKVNNRTRYCYKYKEGIIKFIDDPLLVVCNNSTKNYYVAVDNYIYKINLTVKEAKQAIDNNNIHKLLKRFLVGIVDRSNKRIHITKDFGNGCINSIVPLDWELTYSNTFIDYDYIIENRNDEEFLKVASRVYVDDFVRIYSEAFLVLQGSSQIINRFTNPIDLDFWERFTKMIRKYKPNQYDWYSKPIPYACYATKYKGWSTKYVLIKKQFSLKDIVTNKVFSNDDILFIEQKLCWSRYGRGAGISFKQVVERWDTPYTEADKDSRYIYDNRLLNITTYQDFLRIQADAINSYNATLINEIYEENTNNRYKALLALNTDNKPLVDFWREVVYHGIRVTYYKRYVKIITRGYINDFIVTGSYITQTTYSIDFDNIELYYDEDINKVITSNYNSVSLNAAINIWNYFVNVMIRGKTEVNQHGIFIHNVIDKDIHVGGYTLQEIGYSEKTTIDGIALGYYDWYIKISCTTIWLEEIIEFVNYYKLNDKFKGI